MSKSSTIPGRVKEWAELYPDREVFIFYSDQSRRVLTCRDVHVLSNRFATLLQRRGLKPGDVVCNTLANSPERVVTDFGIIAAGCITTNGQALLTDGTDLMHIIKRSKCRLLITDAEAGPWSFIEGHLGVVTDGKVESENAPNLEMVQFISVEKDGFFKTLMLETEGIESVNTQPSDICFFWCTSGTTGFSKLISLDHETAMNCAKYCSELFGVTSEKKLYSDRPLGWAGGWSYSYMDHAVPQVMIDSRGTVADQLELSWRAIVEEKCTFAVLPLSILKSLAERGDLLANYGSYLLDLVIATGQPFRKHCYDVIGKVCRCVSSAYGMSEVGYITSFLCTKEEDFEDNLVGKPYTKMLEVKIVDEDFHEVKQGQNGQVLLKGCTIYGQYANNPEATKSAFTEDGWLKTGDMGHQDIHGRFYVEGRKTDAIMHGGYIIYPSWVEREMRSCPFIAEVMVVGIPDEIMCHRICACVIPKPGFDVTGDKLKEYCDPMFTDDIIREISAKPEFYIVVTSFPLRPTGKPDRRALADIAAKMVAGS